MPDYAILSVDKCYNREEERPWVAPKNETIAEEIRNAIAVRKHYDAIIDEINDPEQWKVVDPVHDPEPLKAYMNKWWKSTLKPNLL